MGDRRGEALIILGMHRSGLSAAARITRHLGFHEARSAVPQSRAGESAAVVQLNQKLLHLFERDWDDPRPIDRSSFDSARTAALRDAARDVIAQEFDNGERIVLKDPRLSRLAPFWHRLLEEMRYAPRYLLVYRNPVDVAQSLKLSTDHAQQLWLAHTLEALEALKDKPAAFLSYDDLLARREAALGPAFDQLGFAEGLDRSKLTAACAELDAGLRHSLTATEGLLSSQDFSVFVKEIYSALRLASQRPELAWRDAGRLLARWRDAWDVLSPARRPLFFKTASTAAPPAQPEEVKPEMAIPAVATAARRRAVIMHYHFFKNAGSSIDAILKKNFNGRWVDKEFPISNIAANVAEVAKWIAESDADAFSSHTAMFPLPALADTELFPIVFVRHPIDRIRSAYDFERKQEASTLGARLAKEYDFAGYVAKRNAIPRDRQCRDFQCSRLALLVGQDKGSEAERARQGLKGLPFFGLVEAFDQSIERLEAWIRSRFPDFKSSVVHANATSRGISLKEKLAKIAEELGPQRYKQLEHENAGDIALFELASAAYQFDIDQG